MGFPERGLIEDGFQEAFRPLDGPAEAAQKPVQPLSDVSVPEAPIRGRRYGGPRKAPADLRGLKSFRDEYPESRAIILYRGRERILREGILCLPCGDFLIRLLPDKTIDDACRTLGGGGA